MRAYGQTCAYACAWADDPLEKNNLYSSMPDQVAVMEKQLDVYFEHYVPDFHHAYKPTAKADPANFDGAWSSGWC